MVPFRSMKTSSPVFAILVLALLSGCQTKQQLTAQPGYSADLKTDEKIVTNNPGNPKNTPAPDGETQEDQNREARKTDLRLARLTFETSGSKDLLYSIGQDKDGTLILSLARHNFTSMNHEIVLTGDIMDKVSSLFEGKGKYGGILIQNGNEVVLDSLEMGDSQSKVLLETLANQEWTIRAPILRTKGMETLFDDLRRLIEEKSNPSQKQKEVDQPASGQDQPASGQDQPASGQDQPASGQDQPASGQDHSSPGADNSRSDKQTNNQPASNSPEACKSLRSLEGIWTSTIAIGDTKYKSRSEISPATGESTSGPIQKFLSKEVFNTERNGVAVNTSEITSTVEYDPRSCMVKKSIPSARTTPESTTFFRIVRASKTNSSTKIGYVFCKDESCSDLADQKKVLEAELQELGNSVAS